MKSLWICRCSRLMTVNSRTGKVATAMAAFSRGWRTEGVETELSWINLRPLKLHANLRGKSVLFLPYSLPLLWHLQRNQRSPGGAASRARHFSFVATELLGNKLKILDPIQPLLEVCTVCKHGSINSRWREREREKNVAPLYFVWQNTDASHSSDFKRLRRVTPQWSKARHVPAWDQAPLYRPMLNNREHCKWFYLICHNSRPVFTRQQGRVRKQPKKCTSRFFSYA